MKHKKMEYCRLYESHNYTRREQEAMNENLTTFKSKELMLRSFHQMVYNLVQNSTNCEMETGPCIQIRKWLWVWCVSIIAAHHFVLWWLTLCQDQEVTGSVMCLNHSSTSPGAVMTDTSLPNSS